MKIADSVCIVTGGASGLGRGTTSYLLEHGARLAVLDTRPIPSDLAVRGAAGFEVDITDDEAVVRAVDAIADRFGAVHVVVNCAGIVESAPTLGENGVFPIDLFRRTLDVNLTGTYIVLARAAERMAANEPNEDGERGVIVNTASIAGLDGSSSVAYAASKGGVISISLTAARDLAAYGIRVNAIAPGYMDTEMFASLDPEYTARLVSGTVFPHRLGRPAEFGRLVRDLIENPYINATTIRLDSGTRN